MLLAVCGKPIAHSASPQLHRAGMKDLGIEGSSFRIVSDTAAEALLLARELGVSGMNVTAPFKEKIAVLVNFKSSEAKGLNAVNTIHFDEDGTTAGYNTDICGVAESLQPYLSKIENAVVLGAGGAGKAACQALEQLGIKYSICNRSFERGSKLAASFGVDFVSFDDIQHESQISHASLLINTLSTLDRPFAAGLIKKEHIIFDANYKKQSEIISEALSVGSTIIPGQDWLIYQSRASQEIFFGKAPNIDALKDADLSNTKKPIALIGMMGSGKTAVGQKLAERADLSFKDLDARIEKAASKSINQIFAEQGEAAFRALETAALKDAVSENAENESGSQLISCGGGIVLDHKNRELLKKHFKVIWLFAKPLTLSSRLSNVKNRPLLKGDLPLGDRLEALYKLRKNLYADCSDLVISTEDRSEAEVMERIYEEVC